MKKIIAELTYQHRQKGYDHGYVTQLPTNEAVQLVHYLKSFNHWYYDIQPCDGIEILPPHCDYIEKYILKKKILDLATYEIILGFIDTRNFEIYDQGDSGVVAISSYFREDGELAYVSFLTYLFAQCLSDLGFDWSSGTRHLTNKEFQTILSLNREMNRTPLEMDLKRYRFSLEVHPLALYHVDSSLQLGIPSTELLN